MSGRLRALILQHEEPSPPGYLAEWLDEQGADFEVHRIDLEEREIDPRDYDMIASLGSEFAAFDDTKPFIRREAKLLRQALDSDVPVLGLCFGGQLLARVMGGESFRHDHSEIGWLKVRTKDPELVSEGPWFQWHFDSFTVPPGGRLIAESDVGPQAYVIGRSLGLQFHPEVTTEIMDSWVKAYRHELDGDGVDPDALMKETRRLAPDVRRRSEKLFNRFLTRVVRLAPGIAPKSEASA
jgi:GMP synthase (glutamine-hydrolysing)